MPIKYKFLKGELQRFNLNIEKSDLKLFETQGIEQRIPKLLF